MESADACWFCECVCVCVDSYFPWLTEPLMSLPARPGLVQCVTFLCVCTCQAFEASRFCNHVCFVVGVLYGHAEWMQLKPLQLVNRAGCNTAF